MDCFQDFCLYCDRDSPDGPYCSQRCKLADVERSNPSSPTSPQSTTERNWASSQYHQQRQTPSYNAPATGSRPRSSYFMWPAAHQQSEQIDERQLTPSSSRTSLSSTTSNLSSSGGYSRDAKAQLNEYFSALDAAKAAKRRSSVR